MIASSSKLRFGLLMAWRETRAAPARFAFLVLSAALGTGALTAVTGFNASVHYTLSREARSLMAADVAVRLPARPSAAELRVVEQLADEGIETTRVTETVSMASQARAGSGRVPILVSVKGADLQRYPFYGSLQLDPRGTRLDAESIAVSDDLLLRLSVQIGDSVRVGNGEFRIAARIAAEPDRMTTGFTLGPRVLFTGEGLAATGIVSDVSRVTERVLLKLPETTDPQSLRSRLESALGPRARITDYTETNPTLTRALDRSTRFLAMVSLVALIVGGLGVGATVQSHLRQKMTNIAFMKCVGGRSQEIIRIYLTQACLLGLAGSLLGAFAGAIAQSVFARIVSGFFDVPITLIWPVAAMAQGTAAGLLTVALFSLPPLLAIRKIRPIALLQRNFEESGSLRRFRERVDVASVGAAVGAVVGLWAIAIWVSASLSYASGFAASLLAGFVLLGIFGRLLLGALQRASRLKAVLRSRALRHGIANLYRPGAHTVAILTSLGLGVMFTTSIYLVQYSLLEELRLAAPPDSPNVFLVNITEREQAGITEILQTDSNVTHRQPLSPAVSSTLVSVDGTPAAELTNEAGARRFANTVFVLTWSKDLPAATTVLQGEWWTSQPSEPLVSVNETAADVLGIHLGSVVEWSAAGSPIRARVANIRRTDGFRTGVNNQFILSPGTLDGLATAYFGAVRVLPHGVGALQARVFASYPTVTVVNAADILEVVQNVMDKTSQAIRFVAGFAIAGGLIVLATSVAGTRQRRMREVAIFRTVGATRGALIRIFSAEFAAIGIVAGALGSLLASALAAALATQMFDTPYRLQIVPAVVATTLTAVLTVASGWLASRGILSKKPLDILRSSE